MKPLYLALIALTVGSWSFSGCSDHAHADEPEAEHREPQHEASGHHHEASANEPDHDEESGGTAKYDSNLGLLITPETYAALGVETTAAAMRAVSHHYEVTASVFEGGPPARASAFVPSSVADDLERHPPGEATLLAVHRDVSPALTQAEIVLALPGNPTVGSIINLTLSSPPRPVLAVPDSAILRSATGIFVYVVHGPHLRRTGVQTGASDGTYVEVLRGLAPGEVVATNAVKQLWLTELRLTKGGGHSH